MAVATDGRESQPRRAGERDVDLVLSGSPVNLANLVTVGRLLMVAPLVWLIATERLHAAFWLFIAAALSDAVDGFIAKRFNAKTHLGSYLDPLADKVLLDGIYVALAMAGWLPVWLIALVIGRDLLIVCGVALIRQRHATFRPRPLLIGKINTFAQILLAACALGDFGGWIDLAAAVDLLIIVVALTTLLSGLGYAGQAVRSIGSERTS
jgi:cardiolipin synthase